MGGKEAGFAAALSALPAAFLSREVFDSGRKTCIPPVSVIAHGSRWRKKWPVSLSFLDLGSLVVKALSPRYKKKHCIRHVQPVYWSMVLLIGVVIDASREK